MANFKGSVFASTAAFADREVGPGTTDGVLAELDAGYREALQSVTAVAWIPVDPVLAFIHELERQHGGPGHELCVRLGHFSAAWSMNTVIKMYARLRSPRWLIEKGGSVWRRYHDTGSWQFTADGARQMTGHLQDFAVVDDAFCARLRGWFEGAGRLTGGTNAEVKETRCTSRGDDACTFTIRWDAG